jgi:hypothetical protein
LIKNSELEKKKTKRLSALTNRYYRHGVQDELIVEVFYQNIEDFATKKR